MALTPDQLTILVDLNGLSARNPNPDAQNDLHHLIPKPNGTHRLIGEPRPLLKRTQRSILSGLLPHVPARLRDRLASSPVAQTPPLP